MLKCLNGSHFENVQNKMLVFDTHGKRYTQNVYTKSEPNTKYYFLVKKNNTKWWINGKLSQMSFIFIVYFAINQPFPEVALISGHSVLTVETEFWMISLHLKN